MNIMIKYRKDFMSFINYPDYIHKTSKTYNSSFIFINYATEYFNRSGIREISSLYFRYNSSRFINNRKSKI